MAQISDLIDVIHMTIIHKYGENNIILDEIKAIEAKMNRFQEGGPKLENLSVNDEAFYRSLVANDYDKIFGDLK